MTGLQKGVLQKQTNKKISATQQGSKRDND